MESLKHISRKHISLKHISHEQLSHGHTMRQSIYLSIAPIIAGLATVAEVVRIATRGLFTWACEYYIVVLYKALFHQVNVDVLRYSKDCEIHSPNRKMNNIYIYIDIKEIYISIYIYTNIFFYFLYKYIYIYTHIYILNIRIHILRGTC